MRIFVLCSLLAAAVYARPQTNTTSDWKRPIETHQIQNDRYTNQSARGLSRRASSTFIPIDYIRHASANHITLKNNNSTRGKTHVKYKISPVSSLKSNKSALSEQEKIHKFIVSNIDNLNRTKVGLTPVKSNKHWPDSDINSVLDLSNYNNYIRTTTVRPKRPLVQNIVTKVAPKPIGNKNNGWQQIQIKPTRGTTESNYISAQGTLPINVIQNSNPFPLHLPANNVQIETLVTLAPGQPLKGTNVANRCPIVTVTSNTIYNKEVCPDLDIVINNHIQTNTNIFTEAPLQAGADEAVDYAANASDNDSVEVAASETVAADETPEAEPIEIELDEVGIQADPEAVPVEDGLGESVASSGTETEPASSSSSQSGNRPQLPNLPQFPQNDNNDDDDDDDDGIFDGGLSLPNPLDFPFISFVLFPLALLLTGALGLTTFFIPWTVFPTIFLSRKAKRADLNEPVMRPDGWFWHERYQSWANVHRKNENVGADRAFADNSLANYIVRLIEEFGRKYNETTNKSWKRRKKN